VRSSCVANQRHSAETFNNSTTKYMAIVVIILVAATRSVLAVQEIIYMMLVASQIKRFGSRTCCCCAAVPVALYALEACYCIPGSVGLNAGKRPRPTCRFVFAPALGIVGDGRRLAHSRSTCGSPGLKGVTPTMAANGAVLPLPSRPARWPGRAAAVLA
jgi:hypothetical protein